LSILGTVDSDPLILDLDHNGLSFGTTASFDINGDGTKDQVAWNTSNDGILALDVNGNGQIDNGNELFTTNFNGGHYASGVDALASLDSNHDGVIDARDIDFSKLQIWQDANHDGVVEQGEMSGLTDHGIASIGLTTTATDDVVDGQSVTATGTFTLGDGSTGTYSEVGLDTSLGAPTALLGVDDPKALSDGVDWDNVVLPTTGQPGETLQGTDGADKFTLTDAHAVDFIADYNFAQGDTVDLSALLGHNSAAPAPTAANAADFVHYDSGSGMLSVDVSGSGHDFVDVAVLNHPVPDVKVILDDGVDVTVNHIG